MQKENGDKREYYVSLGKFAKREGGREGERERERERARARERESCRIMIELQYIL